MKRIVITRLFNSTNGYVLNDDLTLSSIVGNYLSNKNYLYILSTYDDYFKHRDFYKLLDRYKNNIKNIIYGDYNKLVNIYNREVINGYEIFKKHSHELIYVDEMIDVFDILKLNYDLDDYELCIVGYDYNDVDLLEKGIILNNECVLVNNYLQKSENQCINNYLKYKNGIKRYSDLKDAIKKCVVEDIIDEMNFCDNYKLTFTKEDISNMDIIDLRKFSVLYKTIYEYIDNYYLKTGLYDINKDNDLGEINIPKYIYDTQLYLSLDNLFADKLNHHAYKKTLKR